MTVFLGVVGSWLSGASIPNTSTAVSELYAPGAPNTIMHPNTRHRVLFVSFGYLRRSTSRSFFAFLRALKPDWSISAACDKHWPLIGRSKLRLHVRVTKMHARAARACAQKSRAHAAQQGVTQNLTQRLHGSRLRRKAARLRRRTKLTSQTVRTAGAQVHEISWHAR